MKAIWVFSPSFVVQEALTRYVEALGFDTRSTSEGACAAVFDLTAYGFALPPAPAIPCLAIVHSSDPAPVREALELGYHAAHRPLDHSKQLVAALGSMLAGEATPHDADTEAKTPPGAIAGVLTPREAQVLGLVMLGLPNKRIAKRLGITERTIKHHVSSLMRKYRTTDRMGLLLKSQATLRS